MRVLRDDGELDALSDSVLEESAEEILLLVAAKGTKTGDAMSGTDYLWLTVPKIVDRLSFNDPAPTASTVKNRTTQATHLLDLYDGEMGWW